MLLKVGWGKSLGLSLQTPDTTTSMPTFALQTQMANCVATIAPFKFEQVELRRDKVIGVGSYGAVCRAKCDQLPCAAKILHTVLFKLKDPGSQNVLRKFEQECQLLSSVRHPNIVQYLGVSHDAESDLPVLLMELMDESLTQFLEQSQEPLPYHIQLNLCHDIALGLAYLHSNAIIHRDLSSNNVLLIGTGSRAKITDFGMSKLIESSSCMTQLTRCPGTAVYMPPEALRDPPTYSAKLDIFSFGALTIQIITRRFPDPSTARMVVEDPRYPTGKIEVPIPEIDRRRSDIKLVESTHPLLPIAFKCLNDNDLERPYAKGICQKLDSLKETTAYEKSLKGVVRKTAGPCKNVQYEQEDNEKQIQIHSLEEKFENLKEEMKEMRLQKNEHIQCIKKELLELKRQQHLLTEQKAELESEADARKKEFKKILEAKDQEIIELQLQVKSMKQEACTATGEKFQLTPLTQKQAPFKMSRGSVAVEGNKAYFRSGFNKVYRYDASKEAWAELPECPQSYCTLSIVNSQLTAVGGWLSREATNKLLSYNGDSKVWSERFPAMPTKRLLAAVVRADKMLVVAGGQIEWEGNPVSSVEIMKIDSEQWFIANELPKALSQMAAIACNDRLYLAGGFGQHSFESKAIFNCSISALFKSARSYTYSFGSWLSKTLLGGTESKVWQQQGEVPVSYSAVTSIRGQLVAVGGRVGDSAPKVKSAIRMYRLDMDSWHTIGTMQTARWNTFAVTFKDEKVVIVGGYTTASVKSETDWMEIIAIH